jgi:hypothetical protein
MSTLQRKQAKANAWNRYTEWSMNLFCGHKDLRTHLAKPKKLANPSNYVPNISYEGCGGSLLRRVG